MNFFKSAWLKMRGWGRKVAGKISPSDIDKIFSKIVDFFGGTAGELWRAYGDDILKLVLSIATGEVKPKKGQRKTDLFVEELKKLIDTNKDGKITWDDLDESTINLLRELVYWVYFKSTGSSETERIESLKTAVKERVG